ncbi:MAG: helix-turn-helix domain-containing protein [Akkermansiaceae bacterium]|nr:helix-turn-helix domain-containing protein [Akkermansiaceae bacterium]
MRSKEPKQQKRAGLLRKLQALTDELLANNANDTPLDGIPDGYVSCAHACAMLRISNSALRKHIDKGHISSSSNGWRVYCSIDDIRAEIVRQRERKQAAQKQNEQNSPECPV